MHLHLCVVSNLLQCICAYLWSLIGSYFDVVEFKPLDMLLQSSTSHLTGYNWIPKDPPLPVKCCFGARETVGELWKFGRDSYDPSESRSLGFFLVCCLLTHTPSKKLLIKLRSTARSMLSTESENTELLVFWFSQILKWSGLWEIFMLKFFHCTWNWPQQIMHSKCAN